MKKRERNVYELIRASQKRLLERLSILLEVKGMRKPFPMQYSIEAWRVYATNQKVGSVTGDASIRACSNRHMLPSATHAPSLALRPTLF